METAIIPKISRGTYKKNNTNVVYLICNGISMSRMKALATLWHSSRSCAVYSTIRTYIRIKYSFNAISVFFFCRSSTAVVWNLNLMQINDQIQQLIFNLYSFATKTEYRKTNRFSKRKQSFWNDESHNTILNMLNRKHSRNDGYWNEVAQLYPIFEWILLCSSVDFIFTLILKTEVQFLRTFCKILKSQNGPFMKCLHLKIELELSWFNDESVFIVSETKK